jgi:hypothetical protein
MSNTNQLDRSDYLALAALLLSIMALFVSIYEARILKQQQMIMLAQEKTAVWPFLDGQFSFEYSDKVRIRYTLENKGIGPSKIRRMDLLFNKKQIDSYTELVDSIGRYFPDTADLGISYRPAQGDVISPDEQIETLFIESGRFPGDLDRIRDLQLHFEVCYCSVYDDCWRVRNEDAGELEVCE